MLQTDNEKNAVVSDELMHEIALAIEAQHFGEDKTNQIRERLAQTRIFQWVDESIQSQKKPKLFYLWLSVRICTKLRA